MKRIKSETNTKSGLWVLVVALCINAVYLKFNSFRCFNMYDMGSFMDAAYRIVDGQKPYVDFFFNAGPIHLHMYAFFMRLFGFGQAANLGFMITLSSILIVLMYRLCVNRLTVFVTSLVVILTTVSFYWSTSFPLWDPTAHFWGILGVLLLAAALPFKDSTQAFRVGFACAFIAVISFITKTNLGFGYGVVYFFVILSSPHRLKGLWGFFCGVLGGAAASIIIIRFPFEFFDQAVIQQSKFGGNRFQRLHRLSYLLVNQYWAPLFVVLLNAFHFRKKIRELLVFFIGISVFGVYAVISGGMYFPANNFLWGVQMALAFMIMFEIKKLKGKNGFNQFQKFSYRILIIGTIMFIALAVRKGYYLHVWDSKKSPFGNYALKSEPLKGWKFHDYHGKPLDEIVEFAKKNISPDETILNLADMYLIYALTARDSFRNVTFAFSAEDIPARGKQMEHVNRAILSNSPDWIIIHKPEYDNVLHYLGIGNQLARTHKPFKTFGRYILLKKQK